MADHSTDTVMNAALVEDAAKLEALGADPGPALADIYIPLRDGVFAKPVDFWMVWNKNGGPPKATHRIEAHADAEAMRLARRYPGQKFIVLAATTKFWVNLDAAQDAEAAAAMRGTV